MIDGVGLYIRGLSTSIHGSPKQAAKRAADHGLRHVSIMAAWQDLKGGRVTTAAGNLKSERWVPYAEAFKAAGIDVGLWFYPWAGGETVLLDHLAKAVERGPVDFLLADPEVGYKWGSKFDNVPVTMRGQGEAVKYTPKAHSSTMKSAANRLMQGLHELRWNGDGPAMGLTSYGVARYHPNLPWAEFMRGVDIASPQLYTVSPKQVDDGIESWWRMHNFAGELAMVPSIPMFGKNSGANLHHHLSAFVDGEEDIDGFIGWSWRQTSKAEWETLARWAAWLEEGLTQTGGVAAGLEIR